MRIPCKNQTTMLSSIGNDILGIEKSTNYYNGQLEKQNEITKLSIDNRILSLYTAFLALEPSDTVFACKDCVDESIATGIDDVEIADSTSIAVFPNPFADLSTITIKLPKNTALSDVSVQISDMIGKPVKSINVSMFSSARGTEFTWDGTDNDGAALPNGTYFIVLNTGKKSTAKKIVLSK